MGRPRVSRLRFVGPDAFALRPRGAPAGGELFPEPGEGCGVFRTAGEILVFLRVALVVVKLAGDERAVVAPFDVAPAFGLHRRAEVAALRILAERRLLPRALGIFEQRREAHALEPGGVARRGQAADFDELAREAARYKAEGYKAMKLRFGWGPVDGAEGMQQNVALVRTVRETVGDGIDAEAHQIPVIPHAGQMHNYHIVMASLNCPMAEYFPPVDVEVGNELFWYIFKGEPVAKDGFIDLDEKLPGLGLTIDEEKLKQFDVIG